MSAIDTHKLQGKVLIDSCGWIEYFAGGERSDRFAEYIEWADQEEMITPTIILYEVYRKIRSTYNEEQAMQIIAHIKSRTKIVDLNDHLAISASDIGIREKMPMADSIILATADHHDATVITSDKHFQNKENVKLIL